MSTWPVLRSYDADHLLRIAMPLGGIGTGTVSLGGRGDLRDWEVMNRPAKGLVPRHHRRMGPFFAVRIGDGRSPARARALEGPLDVTEYDGFDGSLAANHHLPRFRHCTFDAAYPLARVHLSDPELPVKARLEAFNPLAPGDAEVSGLPVAVLRYVIENTGDRDLEVSVCGTLPNFIGCDGSRSRSTGQGEVRAVGASKNRNVFRVEDRLCGLFMDSLGVQRSDPAWGTMSLAAIDQPGATHLTDWPGGAGWASAAIRFWDDLLDDGRLDPHPPSTADMPVASLCCQRTLPPGRSTSFTFLITWHFPNRPTWTPGQCEGGCDCGSASADTVGNYYCTRFGDAWDVARHVTQTLESCERRTVAFVRELCRSDFPTELVEAALFNVSTLRSQTCFRTADGRLYGWEGCGDDRGCCHGSCTHVWNYEQATAYLFGDLSRAMREVEFAHATDGTGCMSFRVNLPLARARQHGKAAADGQMGCLMKLYRDWKLSGDDAMLRALWPPARRALEFCWIEHGWDADRDGVMEGCQHNTMDVEYFGPNPQMTGWYLGALRAVEEMARHLGEHAFAAECRRLFDSGSRWMDAHLWNGRYYEHQVRPPADSAVIPPSLLAGMGADPRSDPPFQLAAGCLVDQLIGQVMAHVCGLGYLHEPGKVRATLDAIVRLNRRRGFFDHFNPMRSYALGDETALLMAHYPPGRRPPVPFPYYSEVMTGFEYTAAVGLLYEGQDQEGLRVIRDIRARYDGRKRNPFDEAECGRHYARAMISWAGLLAWTGFLYSAHSQTLDLRPREGRYFWSNGSAWGGYELRRPGDDWRLTLWVVEGELPLREVRVGGEALSLDHDAGERSGETSGETSGGSGPWRWAGRVGGSAVP